MWQQDALKVKGLPLYNCQFSRYLHCKLLNNYNTTVKKDLCIGTICTNTVMKHVIFIQLYLFADARNIMFLPAVKAVYVVAVQDHRLTDQVRGQRKSFVLFKPCKSRGLAPHILPTHFFSQRVLTPQSHSNVVEKHRSHNVPNNQQEK